MGKLRLCLDLLLPLLILTSVDVVDSLLDEEAANEVHFPKLAVYAQSQDNFVLNTCWKIIKMLEQS